jgi:hypothetical protein
VEPPNGTLGVVFPASGVVQVPSMKVTVHVPPVADIVYVSELKPRFDSVTL